MANHPFTIAPGTQFYCACSGVHTIMEITDEKVIHEYKDYDGKKVTGAFMYRHVFDKYVKIGVIHFLPRQLKRTNNVIRL